MLGVLKQFLGKAYPIAIDRDGLIGLIDRQAAFVSQKTTTEYCRAKAGMNWDKLLLERDFLDSLENGRWRAYMHVLADVTVLAGTRLIAEAPDRAGDMAHRLVGVARACLAHHRVPPDVAMEREPVMEFLEGRLNNALTANPRPQAQDIAKVGGQKVYELLPINNTIGDYDKELVVNSVRFLMLGVHDALGREMDARRVAADLLGPVR